MSHISSYVISKRLCWMLLTFHSLVSQGSGSDDDDDDNDNEGNDDDKVAVIFYIHITQNNTNFPPEL